MSTRPFPPGRSAFWPVVITVVLCLLARTDSPADQVQMQNGDRYFGTVISATTNVVVLQSALLGQIRLPREQVAALFLGTNSPSTTTNSLARATTNSPAAKAEQTFQDAVRSLRASPNQAEQVRTELLAASSPEVNQKFDEMLNGLISGKLTLSDLRNQAADAAKQLRDLRRELGEDAGGALDGYLSILDGFVSETSAVGSTNRAANPR